jgi:antitoxin VapB
MALNIKNEVAHELATELANLTGETLTKAVTEALRERLVRIRKQKQKATAQELLEIGRRCASRLKTPMSSLDHGDFLYDERGLPK